MRIGSDYIDLQPVMACHGKINENEERFAEFCWNNGGIAFVLPVNS